jgi:CheY-like chemotaxis protein
VATTLLLADDSVTIQRVIELTFADEKIRVIAVGDGEQAIARIDADPPDIVLADVGMPKQDGYAVAAHVKRSPALRHIPVLLLTGAFDPVDEARAREVECDGVLVKPFEPQALVRRVRELLKVARRPDPVSAPASTPVVAPVAAPRAIAVIGDPPRAAAVPNDVPRGPAAQAPVAPRPATSQSPPRDGRSQPPATPDASRSSDADAASTSAVESAFELGLDDLDAAFERLDPSAPPAELDSRVVSEFARDLHDLRESGQSGAEPQAANQRVRANDDTWSSDLDSWPSTKTPATGASSGAVSDANDENAATELRLRDAPEPPARPGALSGRVFGDWDIPARPVEPVPVAPVAPRVPPPIPVVPPAPVTVAPPIPVVPRAPFSVVPLVPVEPPVPLPPPAPVSLPVRIPAPLPPAPLPRRPDPPRALVPAAPIPPAAKASAAMVEGGAHKVSIASAFAAILAAEQQHPISRSADSSPTLSQAAVEEVVRRVLTRLTDDAVRKVVLDTAERLVREEIERIKTQQA